MKILPNIFYLIIAVITITSCTKSMQCEPKLKSTDTTIYVTEDFASYPTYRGHLCTPSINISDILKNETYESGEYTLRLKNDSIEYSSVIYHKFIPVDAYKLKVVGITSLDGHSLLYSDTSLTKSFYITIEIKYSNPEYTVNIVFNKFEL